MAEVELLTIRVRLTVCPIDEAKQIGLDWWKYDRHLAPGSIAGAGMGGYKVSGVEAIFTGDDHSDRED